MATRRTSLTLLSLLKNPSRFHFDVGVATEAPIFKIQQQWRSYSKNLRRHFNFKQFVDPIASQSLYFSRRFYSSSSPSSENGLLRWYLSMLESRPVITKSFSSSLIYIAADITSQATTLKASDSFDSIRTLRMAVYGLLILGPSQHLWFDFMSKILPKRDVLTTLKKIFLGQAVYGPCITTVFFSYNAFLQGESGGEIIAKLKRDLLPTLGNGLVYWPICDFLTYKFVPVHLQPLANSSFAYVWTIYLTYMASL